MESHYKKVSLRIITHSYVLRMPIKIYLQVIGHATIIPGIEDCITQGITIQQASDSIRHALFNRRVFTSKLNILVCILRDLQLIRYANNNNVKLLTSGFLTLYSYT
jgi:hypothetical protein